MIVLDNDETGAQTEKHQKRMMGEIAKLTACSDGPLPPADYRRTARAAGSEPVITKEPEGAWSHVVTDKALGSSPPLGPRAARAIMEDTHGLERGRARAAPCALRR